MICAARATSMRASRIGLPISSVMSCAICSARRSTASAAPLSTAARFAGPPPAHAGNASAAAATAASTSPPDDEGNAPTTSIGSIGLRFS